MEKWTILIRWWPMAADVVSLLEQINIASDYCWTMHSPSSLEYEITQESSHTFPLLLQGFHATSLFCHNIV